METYLQLIRLYAKYGFGIKTGLYPWHFPQENPAVQELQKSRWPFTGMVKDGRLRSAGGGLHLLEIMLLESLSEVLQPEKIFVIGNSFGWSTLALAIANPNATILAIDNLSEGADSKLGYELSRAIADQEFSKVHIVQASSPQDVPAVVNRYLGGVIDMALIDGLHTNAQQTKDFDSIHPFLSSTHLVLLHDVLNLNMKRSFFTLKRRFPQYVSNILSRTPSGMAYFHSKTVPKKIPEILSAFTEDVNVIRFLLVECNYVSLMDEYKRSSFRVHLSQGSSNQKTLCFLQKNRWIDELLKRSQSTSWGFISTQDCAQNQTSLLSKYEQYAGTRTHPDQTIEPYVLLVGVRREELQTLAKNLGQRVAIFGELQGESNLCIIDEA